MKALIAIAALLCAFSGHGQTVQPILQPHQTFLDGSGSPCSGCSLFSYVAGTNTPKPTFSDASGTVQNTNPVVLDAAGGASILVGSSAYKFVLIDTSGTTLWTVDQIQSPAPGGSPFLPLSGGTLSGPLAVPNALTTRSMNGTQVVGQGTNTTIQAAVTAAGSTGSVMIPASYAGTDSYTNSSRIAIYDYRLGANIKGVINATDFGAVGDAQLNSTGSISGGSSTLTTTGSPVFSVNDIGKMIALPIGTGGAAVQTTITGFTGPNQVTIGMTSTGTCTGSCQVWWGSDATSALNAAVIATGSVPTGDGTKPGGIKIYVPAGAYLLAGNTSIFVRGGEFLYGAGQTSTQLIDVTSGATPMINIGTSSSGSTDGSGLITGIYDLAMNTPFTSSACLINVQNVSGWNIENSDFLGGGIGICIPTGNTVGLINRNFFDSNLFNGIEATGNGVDFNGSNHDVSIVNNSFFFQKFSAIELEGVDDYTIQGNSFQYCNQKCIHGEQPLETSRIIINGNRFTIDPSPTNSAGEITIGFVTSGAGGLTNSIISNNAFIGSNQSDIVLDGNATGLNTIIGNTFVSSSRQATSSGVLASISIPLASTVPNVISNNTFNSIGGYAVSAVAPIVASGNTIKGAFTLSGVPGSPFAAGAILTNGAIPGNSVIRNNTALDSTYPAYSNEGGAQTVSSSGNVSNWTFDVVNGSATITTGNERVDALGGTFTNSGVATLSSGVVSVTTTAACTLGSVSCNYYITNCGPIGTNIGTVTVNAATAGTGFQITSFLNGGTTATGDNSKVCWRIN